MMAVLQLTRWRMVVVEENEDRSRLARMGQLIDASNHLGAGVLRRVSRLGRSTYNKVGVIHR